MEDGSDLSDVTLYLGPENTLSFLSCRAVSREQDSPAATTESGESGEPGEQLDSGDTGQSSPGINDFHHTMAPQPFSSKKKMENNIFFLISLFLGVKNKSIFL